jgi:hypothetical protein
MPRPRTAALSAAPVGVLLSLLLTLLLSGCRPDVAVPQAAPNTSAVSQAVTVGVSPAAGTVAQQLATLLVKGRAPMTGYSRKQFGPAWPTQDGCDSRNRVLRRDLTATTLRQGGCIVLAGTLVSPYTRGVIHFERGPESDRAQIDHVVALGDAWQTGAQGWTPAKRLQFANDPLELLAVDGPSNQAKGDSDAASWLPPNKAFRCTYATIQVRVKAKYGLWVTKAEHQALATQLTRC